MVQKFLRLLPVLLLFSMLRSEEPPPLHMRSYPATVSRVLDGDTAKVKISLGFGIFMENVSVRLFGVWAPEKASAGGEAATAKLKELLPVGSEIIVRPVITLVGTEQMSFTRYIGKVWNGKVDICDAMTKFLSDSGTTGGTGTQSDK